MTRKIIVFVIVLIPTFLFLQGCQDNIILPDTVNNSHTSRLLYAPKIKPCKGIITVDYFGRTYHAVEIGSQCWLRENLDVGIMIQGRDSSKDNNVIEKFCYNDSIESCNKYGGLYQWNEAMQYITTPGAQGICPDGFHVPILAEFQTLSDAVGEDGNALKAIGQGAGDGAGTNTSGFSALLAGYRTIDRSFNGMRYLGFFRTSTEEGMAGAYSVILFFTNGRMGMDNLKERGFSVRCLKD